MSDPNSTPLTLGQLQRRFTQMVGHLIDWTYQQPGHELTLGEAWRTPEQAQWNAAHGTGIKDSLHIDRLAIDLNLFVNGEYKADTESYRPMGEFWESIGGSWGGR